MSRIKELEELIAKYRDIYYNGSEELQEKEGISDAEYDILEAELRSLDPHNDLLEEVGSSVPEEGRERLVTPMLSQEKALTEEEANKCLARFDRNEPVILTEKLDGCGLDITYIDGKITSAVTRGTWIEGTQVVEQAKCIKNIPQSIKFDGLNKEVHVRGEVVIRWNDFNEINEEQILRGEEEFSNPRNLAAGTIKIADLEEVKRRRLYFVAYEIFAGSNLYSMPFVDQNLSYGLKLDTLKALGFDIPQTTLRMVKDNDQVVKKAYSLLEAADKYPYAIDGIVIKMDNLEKAEELGATTHHPRCSFAVKPLPEIAWVEIDHIDWTMSRLGTVTPTAVFDGVNLSGAIICRCNLHNLNNMERLNAAKGTKLKIIRSGLVIPRAIGSDMHRDGNGNYDKDLWKTEIPEFDPSTGEPVHIVELTKGGAKVLRLVDRENNYFAVAKRCEQFLKEIRALGWGEALLVEFCKNSGVKTVADFISFVKSENIRPMFKDRNISESYADKLKQAVLDATKSPDLVAVVKGLGISHAQSVVEQAAQDFHSVEDILNPAVWKKYVTQGIFVYIEDDLKHKHDQFESLLRMLPLTFAIKKKEAGSKLAGKSFVITGTLTKPRSEFERLIKENGGTFQSAISSKTTYLLCGAGGGSKRAKAASLGVETISEEQFMAML